MGYFSNNKEVNFDILRKSGIYSNILLNEMEKGNYKALSELLSDTDRKNRDFMEPLLYAVKNEYATYEVYRYYGKNLQEDLELARDIVIEEPELIEDTPVSGNKQFILEVAEINPKVVQYMSHTLKEDSIFTEKLCELKDKEVTMYVAKECTMPDTIIENPNLAENKEFMTEAVKEDAKVLEYASDELKNDYEFMKEVSKNKETINYVVEHTKEFGEKGLSGTKDALIGISSDEAISGFEEEQENIKRQIEQKTDNNSTELEELLKRDKQLQRHIKFFEKIKNGEVDPVRAAKLIDKVCVNLDDKYREEIKQLLKLDEAILEKQKERKDKESAKKQDEFKILPEDTEKVTERASLEGVQEETGVIREEIKKERETKTNQIGENSNDKSNDEKA